MFCGRMSWTWISDKLDEENLFACLEQTLQNLHVDSELSNFPVEARLKLFELLTEPHEPQVWLRACAILAKVCNVSSGARNKLAQYGALTCLANVLNESFSALEFVTPSPEGGEEYKVLVRLTMTMMMYFIHRESPLPIRKFLQDNVLDAVLSAVDCNMSALYVLGTSESKASLESLIAAQSLVGCRKQLPEQTYAGSVYKQLLGCNMADIIGDDSVFGNSWVVDLYNTNEDNERTNEDGAEDHAVDDVHIIEQLSANSCWKSMSEDFDGEWVNVHVTTCVLDGGHFVAVFGANDLELYSALCRSVEAAVADHSTALVDLPSPGQVVYVAHPRLGSFRAYVVKAEENDEILTFAPDCGYVERVPLNWLRKLDGGFDICLPKHPLIHVCKLFGRLVMRIIDKIHYWITSPDVQLQTPAVKILLNLSEMQSKKVAIAKSGILNSVIHVIDTKKSKVDDGPVTELIVTCLMVIDSLMTKCRENQTYFIQLQADDLVRELCLTEYPDVVRAEAVKIKELFLTRANSAASSNSLSLEEQAANVDIERMESAAANTDPSITNRQYVLNELLPLVCDEQCELSMIDMDIMSLDGMSELICAFLNSNGGQILYGIQRDWPVDGQAMVHGIICSQEKRDQFRLSLSKLVTQQISPPVMTNTVTTHFWPVIKSDSHQPIDDLFVVGIIIRKPTFFQPTLFTAISARARHSFIRSGNSTDRMKPPDVYAWMVQWVERTKLSVIDRDKAAILKLQQVHEKLSLAAPVMSSDVLSKK